MGLLALTRGVGADRIGKSAGHGWFWAARVTTVQLYVTRLFGLWRCASPKPSVPGNYDVSACKLCKVKSRITWRKTARNRNWGKSRAAASHCYYWNDYRTDGICRSNSNHNCGNNVRSKNSSCCKKHPGITSIVFQFVF